MPQQNIIPLLGQLFNVMAMGGAMPPAMAQAPGAGGGGDPKGKRPMPPAYINKMRLPADMADAMYRERGAPPTPVSPGFRFMPAKEQDPAYSLGIEIAKEGLPPFKSAYENAFQQSRGNAYKADAKMQDKFPYSSSAFGTGAKPYAEIMTAQYGEKGAKRIIEQLQALYRANAGGSLAAVDITKPISVKGMMPGKGYEGAKAMESPEHGILVSMPDLSNLIDFSNTAVGANTHKDAVRNELSDTIREEMIHSTRRSSGREQANGAPPGFYENATPQVRSSSLPPFDTLTGEPTSYTPWERYVRAQTEQGGHYKDASALAGAAESDAIKDPSKFYIMGQNPYFAPLFDDTSGKSTDIYRGTVEEIRAKLVKAAQTLGYHPLMHPDGLNAGIDELLKRMEKRGKQNGLIDDGKIVSPSNDATLEPYPEMSDPMYYYGKFDQLKSDPSKKKEFEALKRLFQQVFRNWATDTGDDYLGIRLPEVQRA